MEGREEAEAGEVRGWEWPLPSLSLRYPVWRRGSLVGSLMGHMGQTDRPIPGSLPKGNGNPIIALLGQRAVGCPSPALVQVFLPSTEDRRRRRWSLSGKTRPVRLVIVGVVAMEKASAERRGQRRMSKRR